MKQNLFREIIRHILVNLGLFGNVKGLSIVNKLFKLDKQINISDEENSYKYDLYSCESTVDKNKLKIIFADISAEKNDLSEFVVVMKYAEAPFYGLYLYENFKDNNDFDVTDALILVSTDGKTLSEATVSISASLLLGMEQLRNLPLSWNKCLEYDDIYNCLISLINYKVELFDE